MKLFKFGILGLIVASCALLLQPTLAQAGAANFVTSFTGPATDSVGQTLNLTATFQVGSSIGTFEVTEGATVVSPPQDIININVNSTVSLTFPVTPLSAGSHTYTLTQTSGAVPFFGLPASVTVIVGAAPTVTAITPNTGPPAGGTAVTITGTDFTGATAVTIGGIAVTSFTVVNSTTLTTTTPAHAAGKVDVAVTTPSGTATGAGLYTYGTGDSQKLGAMQVLGTQTVAQVSGEAISGAVDNAINDGFNNNGTPFTPTGNGGHFNFAADPDARAPDVASHATDPFSSANGSFASTGHGFGSQQPSRIDDPFGALAYAGPTKAPPLRVSEPRDWLGWAEVRGATLDHWNTPALGAVAGVPVLYGDQVNVLAGLSRKFTPDFLVGVLGGYETFDYRSDALQGRLKGDGWTVGSYLGWRITQTIRFDAAVAYSGIGYDGTAGAAMGSFGGDRWLLSSGLTGTYRSYGFLIEPSARVYALWEHENAYTDTLGTLQTARDFSTGRASGGMKLSYPVAWSPTAVLAPYVGLYGDYYFNADGSVVATATAALVPAAFVFDGWSARAIGGVAATFNNGVQVAVGGERSGIGGNFALWTYRARASVPFAAQ